MVGGKDNNKMGLIKWHEGISFHWRLPHVLLKYLGKLYPPLQSRTYSPPSGTVTDRVPGKYNSQINWLDTLRNVNTAHVDHANLYYLITETTSGNPIDYLHCYGQSRMGLMPIRDGREDWSDTFFRYRIAMYSWYYIQTQPFFLKA